MGLLRSLSACFATTVGITVGTMVACQAGLHPSHAYARGLTVALEVSFAALAAGLLGWAALRAHGALRAVAPSHR